MAGGVWCPLWLCSLCLGGRQVWTLHLPSVTGTLGGVRVHFPVLRSKWWQHFHRPLQGALIRTSDKPHWLPGRNLPAARPWALEALGCVGVGATVGCTATKRA